MTPDCDDLFQAWIDALWDFGVSAVTHNAKDRIADLSQTSSLFCSHLEITALNEERKSRTQPSETIAQQTHAELGPGLVSAPDCKALRRGQVEIFLEQCNKISTKRIYKNHIWKSVGHKSARQFEYWQECSDKATAEDQRNFSRTLTAAPATFLAILKKQQLIPE